MAKLILYRRHLAACPHKPKGRRFNRCDCPIWIQGTIEGEATRKALDVSSWSRAEQLKRQIEDGIKPKEQPKAISIKDALDAFIKDCESRNLKTSTLRKYRLLGGRLSGFDFGADARFITEIQAQHLRRYREGRSLGPRTAAKELERLRAFFKFCQENNWISTNPAKPIKAPQVKTKPRLPFSETEIQNILAHAKDDRELAFILTLRHSGLRIGDASLLSVSQFDGERIHLYTSKAGVPISVRVPPQLASLLKNLAPRGGYFFVRGDSVSMHTCADLWRRRIKILCKDAKVTPDHPHRFRHSLAADLLSRGVSVENVAAILGNSPGIVVKHYSQWIASRQEALDAAIASTWQPALVRVK